MDTLEPHAAAPSLRDLVKINRWLGGHAVLRRTLREVVSPKEQFSLLDVGAASGDAAAVVGRAYPNAAVTSLDYRTAHLAAAPPPRVAADAFFLPFPPQSFDIVHASLFLHHFADERAVELIRGMRRLARRAVVLIDLHRHPAAYYFLPASRWLFGWHDVTVNDGRISVEAAFQPDEMMELARAAGARRIIVRKHRPWFRISMIVPA